MESLSRHPGRRRDQVDWCYVVSKLEEGIQTSCVEGLIVGKVCREGQAGSQAQER